MRITMQYLGKNISRYNPLFLIEIMNKKSPFFTASVASIVYFIIFIILKYFLDENLDLTASLLGAAVFWIVIFLVHQLLYDRLGG